MRASGEANDRCTYSMHSVSNRKLRSAERRNRIGRHHWRRSAETCRAEGEAGGGRCYREVSNPLDACRRAETRQGAVLQAPGEASGQHSSERHAPSAARASALHARAAPTPRPAAAGSGNRRRDVDAAQQQRCECSAVGSLLPCCRRRFVVTLLTGSKGRRGAAGGRRRRREAGVPPPVEPGGAPARGAPCVLFLAGRKTGEDRRAPAANTHHCVAACRHMTTSSSGGEHKLAHDMRSPDARKSRGRVALSWSRRTWRQQRRCACTPATERYRPAASCLPASGESASSPIFCPLDRT